MNTRFNMISVFVIRPSVSGSDHQILQLRRQPDDYMGGTWQTIYGQSNPGETAVEAALRELREEAGLVPVEFYRLQRVVIFYTPHEDTIWHCVPFCAIVAPGAKETLNEEHDASRWIPLSHAQPLFMWDEDKQVIREIQEVILNNGLAKSQLQIPLSSS